MIRERKSALTISMLFCLGEWAMHLGPSMLLRVFQGKPLLLTLFSVSFKVKIDAKRFIRDVNNNNQLIQ